MALQATGPVGAMAWAAHGACSDVDPDSLFVSGAAQHRAKRVCGSCPVRLECLAEALDNRIEYGVWGGLTARERRTLLRQLPEVVRWRPLLDARLSSATPARSDRSRYAGAQE
jgi:WhiB family redox-sensing transcriptional regulator